VLDTVARRPYGEVTMAERLSDLRARLLELHKLLLDDQRGTYESTYGPVSGPELLRLLLQHEQFAWLRSLSGMISTIDAALDETEGGLSESEVETFFDQTGALLRSGGDGPFATKYRDALQRSPDVVMAHAAVIRLFRPPSKRRPEP
jgi:hypothetical protein